LETLLHSPSLLCCGKSWHVVKSSYYVKWFGLLILNVVSVQNKIVIPNNMGDCVTNVFNCFHLFGMVIDWWGKGKKKKTKEGWQLCVTRTLTCFAC
jgi:hypothetical protein